MGEKGLKNNSSKQPRISRGETLQLILERSVFQQRIEIIPVTDALGRITAQDIWAENNLPNSLSSRLDGIAIKYGNIKNDVDNTAHWQNGIEYVFCNTGIGIP
ncbi:hypothetical protein [Syntrophaceticus schinkii]|jgi:molybdopterin molybdotransferase|uniref:Molybdopterin biosynthesis enzyme n=1 Tax=Syntrophaceticus schinkii TaxID=499207 RepID=A0A0B7MDM9_9FIRM